MRRIAVLVLSALLLAPTAVAAEAATPAPVITSLSRTSGPYAGAVTVHIYGRYLNGVSRISFDGVNGINLRRVSTQHLIVWTPALPAGLHKVRVVSSHGTSKPKLYRAINDGRAAVYGRVLALPSGERLSSDVYLYNPRTLSSRETRPLTNGWYRFVGFRPGTYAVCSVRPGSDNLAGRYYSKCTANFPVEDSPFSGQYYPTVSITSGRRIDFRHTIGGTIAGRLVDASTGAPLANVQIVVFGAADPINGRLMMYGRTSADGVFRIDGLAPGAYTVCFDPTFNDPDSSVARVPRCHGDVNWPDRATAQPGARAITVAAGVVTKTGVHRIPRGGWLTGTVTSASTGRPLDAATVTISNSWWRSSTGGTDASGRYAKTVLPAGKYRVCVSRYYPETQRCYDDIAITVGHTTTLNAAINAS